jgi:hypothetical protein
VPPVEVVALGQETVGAGVGQPREAAHGLGQRQVWSSRRVQPTSVYITSAVSSSSSLTRQQRPQPSHRLSHSSRFMASSDFRRQKGCSSG